MTDSVQQKDKRSITKGPPATTKRREIPRTGKRIVVPNKRPEGFNPAKKRDP